MKLVIQGLSGGRAWGVGVRDEGFGFYTPKYNSGSSALEEKPSPTARV